MEVEYRVNISEYTDEAYVRVLKDYIDPVVSAKKNSSHFHFFRYMEVGNFHYIKLRVITDKETHSRISNKLHEYPIQVEEYPYNVVEDLGGRFGADKVHIISDMLKLTSELALKYATDDYDPSNQGGVAGVVHLICNTLNYRIEPAGGVKVTDWLRTQTKKGVGP
jgi:hypothetical protein